MAASTRCMPLITGFVLVFACTASGQLADTPTPEQLKFFETKIRPVLIQHCYECHSVEANNTRGGLVLDSRMGLLQGGDSGPAIEEENLNESILLLSLRHEDGYSMPPRGKLSADQIRDFETWVNAGAPDPRTGSVDQIVRTVSDEDIQAGRDFWSFQKPTQPAPPQKLSDTSWAHSPVDQFVLAKLDASNMKPAADASAFSLLRRLTFDLTGLPPTTHQIDAFTAAYTDNPQSAIESMVDELLATDQFGERWGRIWLDVVRYAESTGKERAALYPHAWRYRDYVIDAFNSDKPYDEFLKEQIAGDLLPAKTDEEWAEHLVATGFLAIGTKTLAEQNPRQFIADVIDDQVDATTRVFLGVSVACARCHDHKYEAIPQTDYYALAGIFGSTQTLYGTPNNQANRRPSALITLPISDPNPWDKSLNPKEIQKLHDDLAEAQADLREAQRQRRIVRTNPDGAGVSQQQALRNTINAANRVSTLESSLQEIDTNGAPLSLCMGVQDKDQPDDARLFIRGEVEQPSDKVSRGLPQVLCDPSDIYQSKFTSDNFRGSGRRELAEWMASEDNALTARVMVNRVWLNLIGQGIVRTPEDFASTGAAPTHPELLDYLAVSFMQADWSVKSLIKQIATSRTYRLASDHKETYFQEDPENELLWRANQRRLQAEQIRDAMLVNAKDLDLDRPRASLVAQIAGDLRQTRRPNVDLQPDYRSVYLPIIRDNVPHSLNVFDFAEPTMVIGQREQSATPNQALYLLNNNFVLDQSWSLANRLIKEHPQGLGAQIRQAVKIIYGRDATRQEFQLLTNFNRNARGQSDKEVLALICQSLYAANDFRYLD